MKVSDRFEKFTISSENAKGVYRITWHPADGGPQCTFDIRPAGHHDVFDEIEKALEQRRRDVVP